MAGWALRSRRFRTPAPGLRDRPVSGTGGLPEADRLGENCLVSESLLAVRVRLALLGLLHFLGHQERALGEDRQRLLHRRASDFALGVRPGGDGDVVLGLEIEDLFQPYTILKQGGNIIIQETTALTAIDVNRGTDGRPAMEVNLDAAGEIGRQLRLRNLGGIIVVDFLKMRGKKDHKTLLAALETIFEKDPCTVQIHGITGLGLVEITRKRRTPALQERFSTAFE